MPTRIHGTVESILFARAISNAPALHGLTKMLGWAGEPGWVEVPTPEASVARSEGESSGEEKERRYNAMKKSSLRAQKRKSTV